MLELPIGEVSVRWNEIEGSKLNPIVDAGKMFMDIALLWLRYAIGAWKLPSKQESGRGWGRKGL
jgi:dolichyl-phosphate beta-glucosyltransferase